MKKKQKNTLKICSEESEEKVKAISKLKEFIKEKNIRKVDLSKSLNISYCVLWRILKGFYLPNIKLAHLIQDVTKKKVLVKDWVVD